MKTYVTVSLSKEDIDIIGNEDTLLQEKIEDVVSSALTLMIGNRLVQLKITNLPMREDS